MNTPVKFQGKFYVPQPQTQDPDFGCTGCAFDNNGRKCSDFNDKAPCDCLIEPIIWKELPETHVAYDAGKTAKSGFEHIVCTPINGSVSAFKQDQLTLCLNYMSQLAEQGIAFTYHFGV